VPAPSSGAWKNIEPKTSSCAISLSPAWNVKEGSLPSPVPTCFKIKPSSGTCVNVISLSAPKAITELSESNFKSLLTKTAVEAVKSIVAYTAIVITPSED